MTTSRKLLTVALSLLTTLSIVLGISPRHAGASSHREAPLIGLDPTADNTDLYAFVSPDDPDTVTIIANYIPLEEPAGGPYFHSFDDSVLYQIKVDNNSDGEEDVYYDFRFKTTIRNRNTWLYNTGPIDSLTDTDWNMPQTYSVVRYANGVRTVLGTNLKRPPANAGLRSTPNYSALAAAAVSSLPSGIKVFAGPRDDPFFVDLGSIFDLGGLRPFNAAHVIPLANTKGKDAVAGYNTHSIAIQVPINHLTRDHSVPTDPNDSASVLGIYATASRQRVRLLEDDGTVVNSGAFKQVSRLGQPLINEVVIPVGRKDYWNTTDPADDAQFLVHYTKPELARLVNILYPSLPDARMSNRSDLVKVLLTGIPALTGVGQNPNKPADLLRLNVAVQPAQTPNRLGVLAGDFAGYPNGRRLVDDIVDIELRAVADGYGPAVNGLLGPEFPNKSPNNTIADGVNTNDVAFLQAFPYVAAPHSGYVNSHGKVAP